MDFGCRAADCALDCDQDQKIRKFDSDCETLIVCKVFLSLSQTDTHFVVDIFGSDLKEVLQFVWIHRHGGDFVPDCAFLRKASQQ